jgi:peptidyl-prolyl cis-trans isomerase A (cyclophilin A)
MKRHLVVLAAVASVGAAAAAQEPDLQKLAKLRNPAVLNEKAPDTYRANFDTSKGTFTITVNRGWAPLGADRFYNLVKNGFFDDVRFFRVMDGFMAQFGVHGNPTIAKAWVGARIQDDPVKQSNRRGFVTFATGGPNTRTTQVFINFGNNTPLDKQGFAPFGEVTSGMNVVDRLYSGYGDGPPGGKGPNQARVQGEGNVYLNKDFPRLDFIKAATIAQ